MCFVAREAVLAAGRMLPEKGATFFRVARVTGFVNAGRAHHARPN